MQAVTLFPYMADMAAVKHVDKSVQSLARDVCEGNHPGSSLTTTLGG